MKNLFKKFLATALVAIACFSTFSTYGCGNNRGSSDTIQMILYSGGGALDGATRIKQAVDEYTFEKLGFHVELNYVAYTEYSQKLGIKLNTNEYFDMCYIGSLLTGNTYSLRASEGYFKDITTLLPEYASDIYNALSADVWNAAKINGKIYGVVNEQIFARSVGVAIDKEFLEKLKNEKNYVLTQDKIDEEGLTYAEVIDQVMAFIKADETISPNGIVPTSTLILGNAYDDIFMQNYGFDSLGVASTYPGVIRALSIDETEQKTVINQYATTEFREFVSFCMDMHNKGYIPENQRDVDITENQRVRLCGTYQPGAESDLYTQVGREFELFHFGTPLLTSNNVTSSMTAISVNSKNADKCLKFLNLLYTDKELYNLIALGQEDVEYRWKTGLLGDEEYDYIEYIPSSKYKPYADWAIPTMFNAYRKIKQPADMVEQIRTINANAKVSIGNGFTFVPNSDIAAKHSDCQREIDIVLTQLINGTFDKSKTVDEIIGELNDKLEINGLDSILAEKQNQFDQFLSKK